MNRKNFINTVAAATTVSAIDIKAGVRVPKTQEFKISLAQWSIRDRNGTLRNLRCSETEQDKEKE